ncbi:unnamed protein product [Pleuronectes platessa]|uniref:Uncharacterized protein n=1 Tax=Pleuronectes platessa TaxID=8262 RepID=A0A9N7TXB0_PLEPL|nr:unnamed protein product [Pleuronectes platessa]
MLRGEGAHRSPHKVNGESEWQMERGGGRRRGELRAREHRRGGCKPYPTLYPFCHSPPCVVSPSWLCREQRGCFGAEPGEKNEERKREEVRERNQNPPTGNRAKLFFSLYGSILPAKGPEICHFDEAQLSCPGPGAERLFTPRGGERNTGTVS